ncbi:MULTISPECIES: hypothetical protein [unclassified Thermosynechococcus]|uniref:hypothetical protein n=1 Tax=unclassified Thermosynechococcus TaxID=2622553 RepID=UPI002872B513|nr:MULTISPECIES: hypothetical protein [unclassified Thermosynechococcus]WNC30469.1 hypothetical protein RHH53_02665 [Thermosynechococcus sp. PKX82]WNC60864.1 hypothetical protein RHJ80_02620 [Thermosynechococcus sp. QS41]
MAISKGSEIFSRGISYTQKFMNITQEATECCACVCPRGQSHGAVVAKSASSMSMAVVRGAGSPASKPASCIVTTDDGSDSFFDGLVIYYTAFINPIFKLNWYYKANIKTKIKNHNIESLYLIRLKKLLKFLSVNQFLEFQLLNSLFNNPAI